MKTWEYMQIPASDVEPEALKRHGANGWEFVAVIGAMAHFKRDATPSELVDLVSADPSHGAFSMGISAVAIDEARTRWLVVEGRRGNRVDRNGAWHTMGAALSEAFVFTLEEAREAARQAVVLADEMLANGATHSVG